MAEDDKGKKTLDEKLAAMHADIVNVAEVQGGLYKLAILVEFRHWQWVGSHDPRSKSMDPKKFRLAAARAAFDNVVEQFPESVRQDLRPTRDAIVESLLASLEEPDELDLN